MNIKSVEEYVVQKGEITVPEIQNKYSVSYSEARKCLEELVARKIVSYSSGLKFVSLVKPQPTAKPISDKEETVCECIDDDLLERVVEWCKTLEWLTLRAVINEFNVSYRTAAVIADWLYDKNFVGNYVRHKGYEVLTDNIQKALDEKISNPHSEYNLFLDNDDDDPDDDDPDDDDPDDDPDDDDQLFDDLFVDDDDDPDDNLNFPELEDIKALLKNIENREGNSGEQVPRLTDEQERELLALPERMANYDSATQTFSLVMPTCYPDGTAFRAKLIKLEGNWYVSDCGNTLKYLKTVRDCEKFVAQYDMVCTFAGIRMIDGELCDIIDKYDDLVGETAYLLRVINSLLSLSDFDEILLTDKEMSLVCELSAKDNSQDVALIINKVYKRNKTITIPDFAVISMFGERSKNVRKVLLELGLAKTEGSKLVLTPIVTDKVFKAIVHTCLGVND